ncbi:MAG: aminotransferase, partial [Rhodobacterales bacterium]|nr:aminotransferase [Rhodobacterales bacterium]
MTFTDKIIKTTRTIGVDPPPVLEVKNWLVDPDLQPSKPLIDVSQAAPTEPPPKKMLEFMANKILCDNAVNTYGPVLGLDELRESLASKWSRQYQGKVSKENVAVTSGCNQAFCASISSFTSENDEVIIPTPWYFNHHMWLQMAGVKSIPLDTDANMNPIIEKAEALITDRTRAIVLVSPNNPSGAIYSNQLLQKFFDLCKSNQIRLIIDETYKDFHPNASQPHTLLENNNWDQVLTILYSFSKTYRMTGHRVGALLTSKKNLIEIEKALDTFTVCPPQLGQYAANWGLNNLEAWAAERRTEILQRAKHFSEKFQPLSAAGWSLKGCGAYFAFVEHPFEDGSNILAPLILRDQGILLMPGTMFYPKHNPLGSRSFRIAFANIDKNKIST